MTFRFDIYRRLEPRQPVEHLDRGFQAEVYDPVWFLGRQWQMGEHQGEDASSPVEVSYAAARFPLDSLSNDLPLDPAVIPPEAIVESEAGDWWTPGRRLALGRAYAQAKPLPPPAEGHADYLVKNFPPPYDWANGRAYDGYKLWETEPQHAVFDLVPAEPPDHWDPAELAYNAEFPVASQSLTLERHDGGDVDWYSVDATGSPAWLEAAPTKVIPTRMRYPGAPHPRWWQIEDGRVDVGGFPPDRGHFATLLLVDLIMGHSDDWFTFPVAARVGAVLRLPSVIVRDSFDESWQVTPSMDWSLFQVRGLAPGSLLLWPTVTTPLLGAFLEDVTIGIDEDANLLWAVESRVEGRDLPTEGLAPAITDPPSDAPIDARERSRYRFRASIGARRYWHPYVLQEVAGRRRFVQGRTADLSTVPPDLFPEPKAKILKDVQNFAEVPEDQVGPVHQIEPAAIPPHGMRLTRRWILARGTDGQPVLWIQRRRLPLSVPPQSSLRFDVFEEG